MSLPDSHLAYAAEYEALDAALHDAKGIRIEIGSQREALRFRFRLNYARKVDREKNKEIYQKGDPMYGSSAYDSLVCVLRQDTADIWWVHIEKNEKIPGYYESLSGAAE